ncbi:MAG TPA: PEP-CTERM sorting domain-containing protein [Verrucomicrobiae bacterium]|nr:PEP-CTERM sorting domain-containing protein [Verrucomicrobiae bacterium]
MNNAKIIRLFLFSFTLAGNAFASLFTIDQAYTGQTPPVLTWNVTEGNPIGQEFTPTLTSLNFVDLYTQDFNFAKGATGGVVSVEIRSQTINGPILGTSTADSLPGGFDGITRFNFTTPVALHPGSMDVIEIVHDSGDDWGVGIITPNNPPYPGGQWILQGSRETEGDMWFDEGIAVPEPSALALFCTAGCLLLAKRKFKTEQGAKSTP